MLFLRGAVPPAKENPDKLLYDTLDNCEDMWTHLFHEILCQANAAGTLVYHNGDRMVDSGRMLEVWTPDVAKWKPPYEPDIIIARGGFPYYDNLLNRYPNAYKIYYGAGSRFWPKSNFKDYDLLLTDTAKQRKIICSRGKRGEMYVKPAAPLFRPCDVAKNHDICFMANGHNPKLKGHGLFIKTIAKTGLTALSLGLKSKKFINAAAKQGAEISWAGWHLRHKLPEQISSCKVGVCFSNSVDSCPRIIPEYLACDLPIVVLNTVNFWRSKYVTPTTGVIVKPTTAVEAIRKIINDLTLYQPRKHYDEAICVEKAAQHILQLIAADGRFVF